VSPLDGFAPEDELRGPYGPNTSLVSQFHKRLGALALEDLGAVARRWRKIVGPAWLVAEAAAIAAVDTTGRGAQRAAALEALDEVFELWRPSVREARTTSMYVTAQYLAATALVALLLRDQLAPEHVETLYDPFAAVVPLVELEASPRADLGASRVGPRPRGHVGRDRGRP
jgi:hypothetical protein